jgi:hypothetical protein
MIVDVRTYTLIPRKLAKYVEIFEKHGLPTAREAQEIDAEGKGGGLVDGKLVREFPDRN